MIYNETYVGQDLVLEEDFSWWTQNDLSFRQCWKKWHARGQHLLSSSMAFKMVLQTWWIIAIILWINSYQTNDIYFINVNISNKMKIANTAEKVTSLYLHDV